MAWTNPRTWVAGEKPTAATMNLHIKDNLNYLYNAPHVSRHLNVATSAIAASTWVLVPWGGSIDTSTELTYNTTTRLFTVLRAGVYGITFGASWSGASTANLRHLAITLDGGTTQYRQTSMFTGSTSVGNAMTLATSIRFAVNDTFGLQVRAAEATSIRGASSGVSNETWMSADWNGS